MKVIICGAGQVGSNIAHYLALEDNDVTVVDQSPVLIGKLTDTLDCRGVVGHACHPHTLKEAGAEQADMLIAVTYTDEINMVAVQVAHSLFNVPTKIARIRSQSYLAPEWQNLYTRDNLPIDVIISPEVEVGHAIMRRLTVPGATEMIPLCDGQVRLVGVRCEEDCPLIHTPLRQLTQLFPDLSIVIVGIVRDGKSIIPRGEDQLLPGDEAFYVVDEQHMVRTLTAFGHEEKEAGRLLIFGGGNIGLFIAQQLETNFPWVKAKVIERDEKRARTIASQLSSTTVLCGDVRDQELLLEANVSNAETVIAVTDDDETNILSSLLAKRMGSERAVTLINKSLYEPLLNNLDVDVVVNPRNITVSQILKQVRRGKIRAAHSLRDGFGELIEAVALETSPLVGTPIREVKLPNGVLIGSIVRDGKVITPRGNTIVQPDDHVVLFAAAESVRKVEKMFTVRLEFF